MPKRNLNIESKQNRIARAKVTNTKERNIAKQYFNSRPSIGNLAKAAYHWWNSVPGLGGEDESGNIIIGGEAPTPGMRNPKAIVKGIKPVIKIVKENATKITPAKWDAAYRAAYERGDGAEGQRLWNLWFNQKSNTATPGKYYRGTKSKRYSYLDKHIDGEVGEMNGIYMTKKPKYAKTYGDVEEFYLRSSRPLETEGSWTGIIDDATRAKIENAGYDAIVNNRFDTGFLNKLLKNSRDETITFDSRNIKSAEPFTLADDGSLIPLTKRANFNINDIRYGLLPIIGGIGLGAYSDKKKQGGLIVKDFKLKFQLGGPILLNVAAKKIKPKVGQFLRNRMFNTVPPAGYHTDHILDFILNNKNRFIEDLNTEALYGKYLGQDSVIGSVYNFWKKGTNPPGRKVSNKELNPLYKDLVDDNYDNGFRKAAIKDLIKPSSIKKGSFELIYPEASFIPNKIDKKKLLHNHSMGTYTISPLKNKKGTEYNDTWDVNPFKGESAKDDDFFYTGLKLGLDYFDDIIPWGKPFNLKGRVYNTKSKKFQKGGQIVKNFKRKFLFGGLLPVTPINYKQALDKINNLYQYSKSYLKHKLYGNGDGEVINLSNKNVSRIKSNTKNISSILTNDFVEKNNNVVRKKKDFVNTTDTLLGDKKIPLSKISTFYGVENGKLKAGPLEIFNDTTTVVPNRAKNIGKIKEFYPGKRGSGKYHDAVEKGIIKYNESKGYESDWLSKIFGTSPRAVLMHNLKKEEDGNAMGRRKARMKYNNIIDSIRTKYSYLDDSVLPFVITENNDTIKGYQLNASPKTLFADENGNAMFVSTPRNHVKTINTYLKKHPMYPIMVDNGRYASYQTTLPNAEIYSGLNRPDDMYLLGTIK